MIFFYFICIGFPIYVHQWIVFIHGKDDFLLFDYSSNPQFDNGPAYPQCSSCQFPLSQAVVWNGFIKTVKFENPWVSNVLIIDESDKSILLTRINAEE